MGGEGADHMWGGRGNDVYYGRQSRGSRPREAAATATTPSSLRSLTALQPRGEAGADGNGGSQRLGQSTRQRLTGNSGNNVLKVERATTSSRRRLATTGSSAAAATTCSRAARARICSSSRSHGRPGHRHGLPERSGPGGCAAACGSKRACLT